MIRVLHRLRALPPEQWRSAVRAAVALAAVRTGLGLVPIRVMANALGVRLDDSRPSRGRRPLTDGRALEVATIVDQLLGPGNHKARCVYRSLVLGHLLRDERPCLRIGVRRTKDQVQAHAWLEIGGCVVAEPDLAELDTFKTLARP